MTTENLGTAPPNGKKVPKWYFYATPVFIFVMSVTIFAFGAGRDGDIATALLVGGAAGFAFNLMWLLSMVINRSGNPQSFNVSTKHLLIVGGLALAVFIVLITVVMLVY
ncbi:MAG: hypothetical protein A2898_03585 [Candidatus Kerfeldbacteria bacterium RIFCSPLOWO2_01_FULL_48_11]|uniref:Uncharacterized protein n=1 Tax=Candidatus Kerfeldbacteria bacterium RIFCSPLOWO2_01_FULL_48_11 TaxID=1798543 RepID=A0A1G2B2B0_9BACT|nr:MAG: hypothetical protein UY34_C0010G0024 [Parcubacteria group bacterium GW2011_GWA2_48_9]OGY83341.1 MAG: hypothetical protein A2898_03585 [Candidatus Kerfeldbacteria bacterium RIFCSPLOWO2_01_FULL_48_11]HCM67417.1 hypothetical protein [Candidatus Kerfeldbacteria bacterium]